MSSASQVAVLRARRSFVFRYGLLGLVILLGVFFGLIVPAVRQKPFSSSRVTIATGVFLLGTWSWGTMIWRRLSGKD